MRLEDIVVATEDGPQPLNHADHASVVLDVYRTWSGSGSPP